MKGDRERCLEAGMDGYLAKPIDADELFEIVERFAAPALGDGVRPRERERRPDAIDVATIVDRLDGDTAAARAMGRLFLMESPRYLRDLHAALDAGDAADLHRAANATQGVVGLLSAIGYDAARRLELIAHEGALADAPGRARAPRSRAPAAPPARSPTRQPVASQMLIHGDRGGAAVVGGSGS